MLDVTQANEQHVTRERTFWLVEVAVARNNTQASSLAEGLQTFLREKKGDIPAPSYWRLSV